MAENPADPKASPNQTFDVLRTHSYDGIEEYDNPMPQWWLLMLYGSIVWAALYVIGISIGAIGSYEDDLQEGRQELERMRAAHVKKSPPVQVDAAALVAASKDTALVASGAQLFTATCANCHGDKGQGLIGPNLTDNHWLHGGSPTAIFKAIQDGIPEKGMPPWGQAFQPRDMVGLVAWIQSVQGSDPPGAKPPQGEPWKPGE